MMIGFISLAGAPAFSGRAGETHTTRVFGEMSALSPGFESDRAGLRP